jgi:anion-transporting  ArsA/GET3 family ATPase
MLDAKRTFDELVERLAPDERTRDEVLSNRIYQQLSGAVAGSQEFTAVAKLYELDRSGRFDVVVLDTPPSRNALDFLDAPDRLTGFLEGRALRVFLAPTGLAAKVVGRGTSVVFSASSTASRSAPRASRRC